ncbi:alpha-amylase family glycosyl hydrolase [Ferruginibacter sp. HRS2-29]|uniref:Ig-like domain-containing protein n=1 Tax=Ferruginibacter sp. HRS2-29 TaxID=2487334 RepID=UPI0020CC7095|nr:alpha-amylase family glycosyl hydrolase [Ferruginibacter sp. HRS2-29]MCP9752629.1 hypothetical protein [Ferruginibacter sp. HRS2-29]
MKSLSIAIACVLVSFVAHAQRLLVTTPEFPTDAASVTISVDCNKGNKGLLNYQGGSSNNVFVHVGVITNLSTGPTDWKYTRFTWGSTDAAAKATVDGANLYSYTIANPRTFFGVPVGETIQKITIIFRNGDGSLKQVNSDGSDMYVPVYPAGQYAIKMILPPSEPRFVPWLEPITASVGSTIAFKAAASQPSNLSLNFNGTQVATAVPPKDTIGVQQTITVACEQKMIVTGTAGSNTAKDSTVFNVANPVNVAALPAGVQEGINYLSGNTSATLVLFAPGKTTVSLIGDFNNWSASCTSQMNKTPDGNYWWATVTGLTPGTEYGFQYLVDNTIRIADPYTQKVLDPNNDQFINAVTYPNLKPYPTGLTTDVVGILQTAEPQYTWQTTTYTKPDKKNLMIYELLIRDFTAEHSYQSLIDSFQYFKNLGINAIELMPVNEFTGNESWGYNPTYYFAPDKYYGTKNKLKEFVDKCHANGIAVLLDVVYNQLDNGAPQAKLYWDAANNRPAANNPWMNISAPHPYSVFNDLNHTSTATQYLVKRALDFWITEYKIDGYRMDLAKGFTQTATNTTTVENYDASRVANLNRYYDATIAAHPDAYMILEFLGTLPSQEEQEYAAHGFMLWGNNNFRYNQVTMGFADNSDISPIAYSSPSRAYNNPASVGYMESHDEERTMYKNLQFGNVSGSYNVKNLATALAREEAAATVFFTVPGPKMIWQFEERGYDIPLTFGGSNVANKPPHWEYMNDANRRHLYDTYKSIIDLRLNNPAIFNNTSFTYDFGSGLVKVFQIADPSATGRKVTVVANMDVVPQTKSVTFQSTGDWVNYISNGTGTAINGTTSTTFNLSSTTQSITLQPGEYHIYMSAVPCNTAAPTVTTPVNICQNATAIPLTATGTGLLWYTSSTGGTGSATAPTPATGTVGSTTYYVSQTAGCEGPRAAIVVNITALPAAPTATTPVSYCLNATAAPLTATGTNLLWYTGSTGGTGSATAPTPSTTTIGNTLYYVSQTPGTCESPRTAITVTITAGTPAPTVTTPVNYCLNATAVPLTATGTALLWYTGPTGGTGSATAPTPLTTTAGNTTYYVSQTQSCGESPRAAIVVTVNPAVTFTVATTPAGCGNNAGTITITTTSGTTPFNYTLNGGPAQASNIFTGLASGNHIVVVTDSKGCSSTVTVTIAGATIPAAPTVTATQTYCQNATASPLTATGTNLLWYTTATGGTGTATAPTPSTANAGTTSYYVSQSNGTCESPRAMITVTVNPLPGTPAVTSPVTYCQNTIATALQATGNSLLWYTTATGGTGTSTAIIPATNTSGTTSYYVSQSNSCGEGPRTMIQVNVNATPAAPSGLNVTNIGNGSATLNWNGQAGNFYTVEYKAENTAGWTTAGTGITNNNIVLGNLTQGITYQWRVSANCSATNSGVYTQSTFATASRNNTILNLRDGIGIKISPNPVHSSAIIDYSVSGYGQVIISIVSAKGERVKVLMNTAKVSGQHYLNITNEFNNLSAGTYFLRVQQNKKENYIAFVKQ